MFYEVDLPAPRAGKSTTSALAVLNPSESRRLLAKATVACEEVRNAWEKGLIIIGRGITNAFVTEELFGVSVEPKAAQTLGIVSKGITNAHVGPPPSTWHVINKGKAVEGADSNVEILKFGPDDVFIKGANAVDPQGLLLYRSGETEVRAFSRKCTHSGCVLGGFQAGLSVCPCHNSQFGTDGKPVMGPAAEPLREYAASLEGSILTVKG